MTWLILDLNSCLKTLLQCSRYEAKLSKLKEGGNIISPEEKEKVMTRSTCMQIRNVDSQKKKTKFMCVENRLSRHTVWVHDADDLINFW